MTLIDWLKHYELMELRKIECEEFVIVFQTNF